MHFIQSSTLLDLQPFTFPAKACLKCPQDSLHCEAWHATPSLTVECLCWWPVSILGLLSSLVPSCICSKAPAIFLCISVCLTSQPTNFSLLLTADSCSDAVTWFLDPSLCFSILDAWLGFRKRDSLHFEPAGAEDEESSKSQRLSNCHVTDWNIFFAWFNFRAVEQCQLFTPLLVKWSRRGGLMEHMSFTLLLIEGGKMIAAFVSRSLSLSYTLKSEKRRAKLTFGRLSHWGLITP